jgi:hypothetical protein
VGERCASGPGGSLVGSVTCVWPGGSGTPGRSGPSAGERCEAGAGSPPVAAVECVAPSGASGPRSAGATSGLSRNADGSCAVAAVAAVECVAPDGTTGSRRAGSTGGLPRSADGSCEEPLARPAAAPPAPRPSAPTEEVAGRTVQRPALDQDSLAGAPARAGGFAPLAATGSVSALGLLLAAAGVLLRRRAR